MHLVPPYSLRVELTLSVHYKQRISGGYRQRLAYIVNIEDVQWLAARAFDLSRFLT